MRELFLNNFDKIVRVIFYLLVIMIPVTGLPKDYLIPVFMKNVPNCLLGILLIISFTYYFLSHQHLYCYQHKWVKIFILFCVIWPFICTIHGILFFPYWDASTDEFLRNTSLIKTISAFYPNIVNRVSLLHLKLGNSMLIATGRDYLMPLLGIPFIIFTSFKNKSIPYILNVFSKAALWAACALALYSLIEIPWLLTGNENCAAILKFINIHLYDVETTHEWWPPVLWSNQLRSYTMEPSFFGIISVFIVPLLWYRLIQLHEKKTAVLLLLFSYMIFMTKARTAQVIFLSEILLFLILSLWGRYRFWKKSIISILAVTSLAFLLYLSLPIGLSSLGESADSPNLQGAFTEYVDKDVMSIGSVSKRSNMARWGNTVALLTIGLKHLLFGVGTGLESPYIAENIPTFAKDDPEINHWVSMLHEKGWLQSSIPVLNEFGAAFSRYGLLGLWLFVLPIAGIVYIFFKYHNIILSKSGLICSLVVFAGQVACLLSNSFFYTYPLSISLAYILILKYVSRTK